LTLFHFSKLDNKWGTIRPIQLEDPKYGLVVPVRAFGPVPVNLEDVFVTLTGEGFGVSG